MKVLNRFILCMASVALMQLTFGQSKELENVVDINLRNSVTIKNNNAIVGYAFFYVVDKAKKTATFRLEILDENLKSIGSNEFEGAKDLELLTATYESGKIMLAFKDEDKRDDYEKFVKVFDLKGKENGLVAYEPEKAKKGLMGGAIAEQMDLIYNGVGNIEGKGFVSIYQKAAKTGGVDIQMIGLNGKLKWSKELTAEKGDRQDIYLSATTPGAIVLFCGERESLMARNSKNFLIGLNPDNGKELYKVSLETNDYALDPMLLKNNANGYSLVSTLYRESDKFYSAKPIGFTTSLFDPLTGKFTETKNFVFEDNLGSVLEMKNASKSEDGYICIQDICIFPDGSKVLVGEFFKRTVSALGVASTLINRGRQVNSATQITIGDMFLLHIDKNNKPVSLEKIDKDPERVPGLGDGANLGLLTRILKLNGDFSYWYTDELSDPELKTFVAAGRFAGEKYAVEAISFSSAKGFKAKKLYSGKEDKDNIRISRAKPGHVLVMKYIKKEKKLTLNLERVS